MPHRRASHQRLDVDDKQRVAKNSLDCYQYGPRLQCCTKSCRQREWLPLGIPASHHTLDYFALQQLRRYWPSTSAATNTEQAFAASTLYITEAQRLTGASSEDDTQHVPCSIHLLCTNTP